MLVTISWLLKARQYDLGEKKRVLVTHDECTLYANDGKREMWIRQGENPIRKKGPGMSIMVSEFQCSCHGTMRVKGWTSRKLFEAGAGRQGYWKSADMIKQLDVLLSLFSIKAATIKLMHRMLLLMTLNEVLADPGKPEFRTTRARKIDGTFFVQDIMSVSRKDSGGEGPMAWARPGRQAMEISMQGQQPHLKKSLLC
ncbi:hypothetical protein BDB01DRAFT_829099 [Pilobolus umbonatus]|nr:hypothetical protein BDB01DRAFT_829099 [Pilobolus umbonatus]